ncbi:hypothetical protein [Rickettsiella massiliensis]|uniref:hypothetical protein n=1 Tax=Rickettsiella massiliensis TaxID=676517 RepID=UPI00029A8C59|nr:hypothetical protein [Rickettsiella massiliensis]
MLRPFVNVELRPKLSVNIKKSYSSKYRSGGGTPAICELLRNPNQYSKEIIGFAQSGQQASSSFLGVKTKSQNQFTLFYKKIYWR